MTESFLTALHAFQAEAPALPKDKTNPQCADCGVPTTKRGAKRCKPCANKARSGERTDTPSRSTGWERARKARPVQQCEYPGCEVLGTDRHHVDDNPLNNDLSNIAVYCRRHHMLVDGRLDALAARAQRVGRLGGRKKRAA